MNEIDLKRQKQMLLLLERYSRQINTGSFTLQYSWDVAFFDMVPRPGIEPYLQREVFECFTNNISFAAMIFEGHKLQHYRQVAIQEMKFIGLTEEIFL